MEFRLGRLSAAILLILASALPAAAQTFVYALESGRQPVICSAGGCHAPTIHLINAATGHELSTVVFGSQNDKGTALRLSSDGRLLFATTVPQSGTGAGTLWVIDALGGTTVAQIAVGTGASDVGVLPDNSRAYIVNTGDNSVSVVDLSSLTVTTTIAAQTVPTRIVSTPAGDALYVLNSGSASVSKISVANNGVEATIGVGPSPAGLDLSPDGSRLFVANSGNATVTVIDAVLDSVLRVIPAGSVPLVDVAAQSPTRIYVATSTNSFNSGSAVQLLNAADGSVLGSSAIGSGGRFARDASGTPVYLVETGPTSSPVLRRVADDATSTTILTGAPAIWNAAAVLTDPCAFEATAAPAIFGAAGGSGVLTIPAPAGCAWTIDASSAGAFAVDGTLTGSGPATRTVSVSGGTTPKRGALVIGRQVITLELTIPRMNIDAPGDGAALQQPFTIAGWAIDQNLGPARTDVGAIEFRERGIDVLHVWAYPASGAAPIFLGTGSVGLPRPDVGAVFGMSRCGFSFSVRTLATGTYTIVVYAHSEISNQFVIAQPVTVTVARAAPVLFIDVPPASPPSPGPSGSIDFGTRVSSPFEVGGWAIDPAAPTGSGVDAVHIWGYPVAGGSPMFVGAAPQTPRPDVAAAFGSQYLNSGFHLYGATLPPGTYDLVVFAHSAVAGTFNNAKVVRITVQ